MNPHQYPPDTIAENVPAFADDDPAARRVILSHPSGNPRHPNLIAAGRRYLARGYTVVVRAPVTRAAA